MDDNLTRRDFELVPDVGLYGEAALTQDVEGDMASLIAEFGDCAPLTV
jgi:hypothetical protein